MSTNVVADRDERTRTGRFAQLLGSPIVELMLVTCCAVAAAVLVRFESLAALGLPRMLSAIGITFVILSALFAVSSVIVKRVLYVRRHRKIDATAAWFIRHYHQLLDESVLNPDRHHPDGTR